MNGRQDTDRLLPRANRYAFLAVLWFGAAVYSLLFRESDGGVPPFPHFDKVGHFALFFAQFWLAAKAYFSDGLPVPYRLLLVSALVFAVGSECAQAWFTATREGSVADGLADMAGAAVALWAARKVADAKRHLPKQRQEP
ncbi:VanZ family protein [Neisseria sp.]|uniref:VanZ family protein n=1 Tax=Neisseria sp. TaxID=192066 RepID=UPI0035A1279F